MKTQRVGDHELAYEDKGEGNTIILLHGFCGSSKYWDKIVPLLDTHRVITIDLRGHGESAVIEAGFSIEDLAKDINYFLDQKQLDQVYLLGHSFGGYVTLAFAELFPEKLKGFGLIHSTPYADTFEAKENRTKAIDAINGHGLPLYIDDLVQNLFSPYQTEELKEEIQFAREIGYNTNPVGAKESLKAMRNRVERLQVVLNSNVPVLLVAGKHDQIIPNNRTFTDNGPMMTEVLLENSGHMGMMEEPEVLAMEIKNFAR
ncbi:pimeloyl-ACP methyl ester carboxylesterase [Bacillus pakistanensis]|uniref:Pimeloyl-ACP methyl ester carboxylesterase n=1 Tax=Rossellomorea pakistanensis TaxID=992288 RepID=A0ABS2N8V7_9BACI|nr:alpha/beta hydrolase [Bacillus pakistanensis]MBM7584301.1 pimeloyl-ACP methyl ester carboxylesterase [Bacillus pakistanensis]